MEQLLFQEGPLFATFPACVEEGPSSARAAITVLCLAKDAEANLFHRCRWCAGPAVEQGE